MIENIDRLYNEMRTIKPLESVTVIPSYKIRTIVNGYSRSSDLSPINGRKKIIPNDIITLLITWIINEAGKQLMALSPRLAAINANKMSRIEILLNINPLSIYQQFKTMSNFNRDIEGEGWILKESHALYGQFVKIPMVLTSISCKMEIKLSILAWRRSRYECMYQYLTP